MPQDASPTARDVQAASQFLLIRRAACVFDANRRYGAPALIGRTAATRRLPAATNVLEISASRRRPHRKRALLIAGFGGFLAIAWLITSPVIKVKAITDL